MQFLFILAALFASVCGIGVPISQLSPQELKHLEGDPTITHKVVFHIEQKLSNSKLKSLGSLSLGLFGKVTPNTVKNFVALSNSEFGFGYRGSIFHRVIDGFMIQGGDFNQGKGLSHSIYNDHGSFDDENFELAHNKVGRLSMANAGPNTNGAQFFICHLPQQHLDGHHVVFGQLIAGFDTLDAIAKTKVKDSKPEDSVVIESIEVYTFSEINRLNIPLSIKKNSHTLTYLFFFVLLVAAGVFASKYYFKKQLIKDKEVNANFYHK